VGGRVGRSIGRRRVSIVTAVSVGAATLGGTLGGHVSGRLSWSLAAFVATMLAGMGCAYYLDRRSHPDEDSSALPEGLPVAGVSVVSDVSGGAVGGPTDPAWLIPQASPAAAMPGEGSRRTQLKEEWVAAVMAFSDMQRPEFRSLLLTRMGDALGLGSPFAVPYSAMASDHVNEIVDSCWGYESRGKAFRALGESLIRLRPYTSAADHMRRLLGDIP
jgi:hypothetical protein